MNDINHPPLTQALTGTPAQAWKNWLAVVVLGISSFSIVTTELAPIGLLSPLANEFRLSTGTAGLIVTAYAWIAAIAALLSATLLSRVPRKSLLIALMTVLALSSFIAAEATAFSTLLIARMAGALAHGAFWAMIGTVGAQLVPPARIGLATSIIFGGVSAASVAGVPLANLLAQSAGWRTAFIAVSVLSLIAAGALMLTLPRLPTSTSPGWRALADILRNRAFLLIYATTACAITAHFAAFTYIEPLLSGALHIRPALVSTLLLVFGVAGILGNVISGKLIDRQLKPLVLVALLLMAGSVLATGLLSDRASALSASALLLGWGIGVAIIFVGFQSWILRLAGAAAMPASAIYVAIFNAAIGAGALVGGAILSVSSLSGLMIMVSAALIISLLAVMLIKAPQQ